MLLTKMAARRKQVRLNRIFANEPRRRCWRTISQNRVRGRMNTLGACEMPHIALPVDLPGILGPLTAYPATGLPIRDFAEALMCGASSLSRAERELIAMHVSARNACQFCTQSHAAIARALLPESRQLVDDVLASGEAAEISPKLAALLKIAEQVRRDGRLVTESDIELARKAGADDQAIHDTVLVAAAFCMFNRYVDGLATAPRADQAAYDASGARTAAQGYR